MLSEFLAFLRKKDPKFADRLERAILQSRPLKQNEQRDGAHQARH